MKEDQINVLSLFDGMSCGRIALDRAGVSYSRYFSSEIDKNAIKVISHKYPDTIHLGDVTKIDGLSLPKIDLLIGGSPCQGFSFSGKMLNFEDERSRLFFEFVRLVKECRPKYFLLENVKMVKKCQDIITEHLGVSPVEINSNLVSAQNRSRLYWANFKITQPEDKNISLMDILDEKELRNPGGIRGRPGTIVGRRLRDDGKRDDEDKSIPIVQCLEVRATNTNKSNCLTRVEKDNVLTSLPIGRYEDAFKRKLPFRYYSLKEQCRLQTVPDDYFEGIVSDSQAKKMLGNGWTVDVIAHIFREMKKDIERADK